MSSSYESKLKAGEGQPKKYQLWWFPEAWAEGDEPHWILECDTNYLSEAYQRRAEIWKDKLGKAFLTKYVDAAVVEDKPL
jgi:hypothetical protein